MEKQIVGRDEKQRKCEGSEEKNGQGKEKRSVEANAKEKQGRELIGKSLLRKSGVMKRKGIA